MQWTLGQLAAWCGGELKEEYAELAVTSVITDSRKIQPGCLFVALKGEKFDGHDYVEDAMAMGAAAVLVSRPVREGIPAVLVADTLRAFGSMAAGYRQMCDVQVVGVTGSVGKTTTKEMIAAILQTTFRTAKTEGNHNNNIGLPMTVLDMPEDTQTAVLEMGMNHFGEMAYLASIAKPDVAVITNIGTMHIEYLGSREGILKAKMEIMQGMRKKGVAVFNGDEPLLWNMREYEGHKKYYYGVENPLCDLLAENIEQMDGGMSFRVRGMGHNFEMFIPMEGMHVVYDAMAAILVGLLYDVKAEKMQYALGHFQNTGMRQRVFEENGMTIIEDCYNAGPESMAAALTVLGDRPATGRRIAVLGDMLELGTRSQAEHYRIGRLAVSKADIIYAYGTYSDRTITGASTGGMDPQSCVHFTTHEAMAFKLAAVAKPGDVLLFKGSRGMKMEHVLKLFLDRTKPENK